MVPPRSDRVSRAPPYSWTSCDLRLRGCHPLRPTFPGRSASSHEATGLLRFRSPLLAESRLMSVPPGTEMFQFPGFASTGYGFTGRYPIRGGLPHSDIHGSTPARGSPWLLAACHVLHRLLVPRHPPNALLILDTTPCTGTIHARKHRAWTRPSHEGPPLRTHSHTLSNAPEHPRRPRRGDRPDPEGTRTNHPVRRTPRPTADTPGTTPPPARAHTAHEGQRHPEMSRASRDAPEPDSLVQRTRTPPGVPHGPRPPPHAMGAIAPDPNFHTAPFARGGADTAHPRPRSRGRHFPRRRRAHTPAHAGGDGRVRTGDPLLAKQVLSRLSYAPTPRDRCPGDRAPRDRRGPKAWAREDSNLRPHAYQACALTD